MLAGYVYKHTTQINVPVSKVYCRNGFPQTLRYHKFRKVICGNPKSGVVCRSTQSPYLDLHADNYRRKQFSISFVPASYIIDNSLTVIK